MFISTETLDDLLQEVFRNIELNGMRVKATKGPNTELSGVLLEIRNPLARLSRSETKGTVFSCLGETLWYLAKTDQLDFIKYYLSDYGKFSDDGMTLYGAYGPRLFSMRGQVNQVDNVIRLLKKKRSSRQAVIQLFNAEDILEDHKDIPCTCTLQFIIRNGRLDLIAYMRSNDAFLGLPHDVFAFTFIQELVARSLEIEIGSYKHAVGSLHLYDTDKNKVKKFLREGYQSRIVMPPMPRGNPWPNIEKLLATESAIRIGQTAPATAANAYWADLGRLLQVFGNSDDPAAIRRIKNQMVSRVYDTYIEKRIDKAGKKKAAGSRATKRR